MQNMINSNPQLRGMVDANPHLRAMLSNPEVVGQMMDPQNLSAMARMQQVPPGSEPCILYTLHIGYTVF